MVAAGERGFNWKSADGAFVVKVRGLIHADGREYLDDQDLSAARHVPHPPGPAPAGGHLLRRGRLPPHARLRRRHRRRCRTPTSTCGPFPWLKLRAGKFKPPVGLERLQSAAAIVFPERALPTVAGPQPGRRLHAPRRARARGVFSYELGVFNGVVDGGSGDCDNNHAKDFAGRLFLQPCKGDPYSLLANLGVGFAGSTGGSAGPRPCSRPAARPPAARPRSVPGLPTYRTAGQQTFFSYRLVNDVPDGTVIGQGPAHAPLAPGLLLLRGPFGLLGEYIQSSTRW